MASADQRPPSERARTSWRWWRPGAILRTVEGIEPRLAQWEKSSSPVQQRLYSYLDGLVAQFGPLDPKARNLFLDLIVDVEEESRLTRHHDLENYLTPLFGRRWFDPSAFVLVTATKRVGGGSRLVMGTAEPSDEQNAHFGWEHFSGITTRSVSSTAWKQELQEGLVTQVSTPLPEGPVEVVLAWRCAPRRNWVSLWKPTGDTMAPVLGTQSSRPFHPNDDRIVSLHMHCLREDDLGHTVHVGMWWRLVDDGVGRKSS